MSRFHVSQIETRMRSLYTASHWDGKLDEVANLSRILALHAVYLAFGSSDNTNRIVEITDGEKDHGIDAVGVDTVAKLVVFVQSKWRQDGTGSMTLADVLKFLQGVKSLLGMRSSGEPIHASEGTRVAVANLLKTPGAKILLVTVTTASERLSDEVVAPIDDLLSQLNDLEGVEPLASHLHVGQAELFGSISDQARAAVNLQVQLLDWGRAPDPQKTFYGRASAAALAEWYHTHGAELFAENIRVVIPRSDINEGILQTIKDEPQNFFYYNNGVTVLAESLDIGPGGALSRDVGYFELKGASIVNGAQTVSTLGAAVGTDFESQLANAYVLVRCIEVPKSEEELGRFITRYANTQNEVSSQDFAFLDPEQHRLVRELSVLGYEYILRSAEIAKSKNPTKIIELREAAVALACASPNLNLAVVAKREVSLLFSNTSYYKSLFNDQTDPLRLSRAVEITAAVDEVLDELERQADGIEAGIAVHGRRVIAHLVMRKLGDTFLKEPNSDMVAALSNLAQDVARYVTAFVSVFPDNSYPGNVFKNQTRVNSLIAQSAILRA